MLKSYSQSQNTRKDIASKQDNYVSNSFIMADKDNKFLLVNKVICCALHLKDLTKKPTNSVLTTQETNKTSFLNGSSFSMLAQSSLLGHLNGSKGTYIDFALFQTKQLLINVQSSQLYLTITITIITTIITITIITTTIVIIVIIVIITVITILTAQAAKAFLAI